MKGAIQCAAAQTSANIQIKIPASTFIIGQELTKAEQELEVAKLEAEAKIVAAQGDAESQKIIASATAEAMAIKIVELAKSLGFKVTESYTQKVETVITSSIDNSLISSSSSNSS